MFEEKTDKGRERRTSRDKGVDGLFGAVSSGFAFEGRSAAVASGL
jgi:hypothetical protein